MKGRSVPVFDAWDSNPDYMEVDQDSSTGGLTVQVDQDSSTGGQMVQVDQDSSTDGLMVQVGQELMVQVDQDSSTGGQMVQVDQDSSTGGRRTSDKSQLERENKEGEGDTFTHNGGDEVNRQRQVENFSGGSDNQNDVGQDSSTGGRRTSDKSQRERDKKEGGHTFTQHGGPHDSRQFQAGTISGGTVNLGDVHEGDEKKSASRGGGRGANTQK